MEHENHDTVQKTTWLKTLQDKQTNLPGCPKHLMAAALSVVFLMFFLIVSIVRPTEQVLRFRIGCLNSELISELLLFLSLK